jgi:hypothetical protein
MIGRRGYRIAERPRPYFRPVPLNFPSRGHRARVCHARDPPTGCGAEIQDLPASRRRASSREGAGPAEAPASPERTKLHPKPFAERSCGMTTHPTSGRAQCKGSCKRSSCGIVLSRSALRSSEAEP